MYKVFFNDSIFVFCSKEEIILNDNTSQIIEIEDYKYAYERIKMIENDLISRNIIFINNHVDELWKAFRNEFIEIAAAGGIVLDETGRILTINRFEKWDLPKGKVEKNEQIEEAAVREVEEECGLSGIQIKEKIGSSFHIYRSPYHPTNDQLILKETHWFEMFYAGNETPVPQVKEGITEVRWMRIDELDEFFNDTFINLREMVKTFLTTLNHC